MHCLQPRFLDDYSVPYDLKKQIEKNPGALGLKSPDAEEVSDDDYSVPYEIKKLNACKFFLHIIFYMIFTITNNRYDLINTKCDFIT